MKNAAFTLAEALITLTIIGVIASLTLPPLFQDYQEKAMVVAVKKIYTVLSKAVSLASLEYGTPDKWHLTYEDNGAEKLTKILEPYLHITKICGIGDKCHTAASLGTRRGVMEANYFNPSNKSRHTFVLNDGMVVNVYVHSGYFDNCSGVYGEDKYTRRVCARFVVDVNGNSKPNSLGEDIFLFDLNPYGVLPLGAQNYDNVIRDNWYFDFEKGCMATNEEKGDGHACAGWVIANGNLDYLRCNDLSWEHKTKCDN